MLKVKTKSLGFVALTSATSIVDCNSPPLKTRLSSTLSVRSEIYGHEIVTVASAPVPWNAISARTMSPVAAPIEALVI